MKNKMLTLVLALLVALSAFAPVALAGTATSTVVLPSGNTGLNVRSGPGTNYDVAGWAVDDDAIELLNVGESWTKIQVVRSGKVGYIKNIYIKDLAGGGTTPPPSPSTPSTSGTAKAGRVSGGSVNLRKGPATSYARVASLSSGTRLKLWDSTGNWAYVTTLAGKGGWISKTYVANGYTATTSARVNLRTSANGALVKTLPAGTKVSVESITGSWSKVKAGTTSGYLFSKYLK